MLIPVRARVVRTLNVLSTSTFQCVLVYRALLEMRLFYVPQLKVSTSISVRLYNSQLYFLVPILINPCSPSPCGPNSQCREINQQPVCSCLPNYIGSPPTCRPECLASQECSLNRACVNQKCIDPCPGTCGIGAQCQVVNHNPICSCHVGQTGDPFTRCRPIRKFMLEIKLFITFFTPNF